MPFWIKLRQCFQANSPIVVHVLTNSTSFIAVLLFIVIFFYLTSKHLATHELKPIPPRFRRRLVELYLGELALQFVPVVDRIEALASS